MMRARHLDDVARLILVVTQDEQARRLRRHLQFPRRHGRQGAGGDRLLDRRNAPSVVFFDQFGNQAVGMLASQLAHALVMRVDI
ncbi:hypothetical protein D3C87_2013820 [compost metagenome]